MYKDDSECKDMLKLHMHYVNKSKVTKTDFKQLI